MLKASDRLNQFFDGADRFCAQYRGSLLGLSLKRLFRINDSELVLLLGKTFGYIAPENIYPDPEPRWRSWLGILLLPAAYVRRIKMSPHKDIPVDLCIEMSDQCYFTRWFESTTRGFKGSVRIAAREPWKSSEWQVVKHPQTSILFQEWVRLIFWAPIIWLTALPLAIIYGPCVLQSIRGSLAIYVLYRSFFRQYPTRIFYTYADERNPPSRYFAATQRGVKHFCLLQNGERLPLPVMAFGAADVYFVFGQCTVDNSRLIRNQIREHVVVGAPSLNERYKLYQDYLQNPEKLYDFIYIDQTFPPFGGHYGKLSESRVTIARYLGRLCQENPHLKIAYQLRVYQNDSPQREYVIRKVKELCGPNILVLDNDGRGASYYNVLRSRAVLNIESTLGLEALRLGVSVMNFNFSEEPAESVCTDQDYQIESTNPSYELFRDAAIRALNRTLSGPPPAALYKHQYFDGQVESRISKTLNSLI